MEFRSSPRNFRGKLEFVLLDDPKMNIIQLCQTFQFIEHTINCFSVNVQDNMVKFNTRLNESQSKASSDRLLRECRSVTYYLVFTMHCNASLEIV
jgi:hypothetical protein